MKTESLWSQWPSIQERILQAKQLLLFLDYDGTLTPIKEHPSKARLAKETRRVLSALARQSGVWIALISGRGLNDLKYMVKLKGVCYVGNHGLELQGPKLRYVNPVAQKCRPLLYKIVRKLRSTLKPIKGAWVENKGLTLSVHYREVSPEQQILVRNGFHGVVRPYLEKRQIQVTAGKQVFEVRPPVRWTKGTIVNWLVSRRRAMTGGDPAICVYFGDDQTDEDAFGALGSRGITVAVGPPNPLTQACYAVESSKDVHRFLQEVLAVCRARPSG